jgi:hypothetical protein
MVSNNIEEVVSIIVCTKFSNRHEGFFKLRGRELLYAISVSSMFKVHKIENFFGSYFEFCVFSLLVMLKY